MRKRFDIAVLHPSGKIEIIYENVQHYGEVELLSQLAMSRRTSYADVICIFPGYNRNIETSDPKAYKMALDIEHKYIKNNSDCE